MELSSNNMAALALMAILLLVPTPSNGNAISSPKHLLNETASHGRRLVGEEIADSEFLMETEISRMMLDFQNFQTPNTNNGNRPAVPACNRPPRYDSCLGEKRSTPPKENCDPYNRVNPC